MSNLAVSFYFPIIVYCSYKYIKQEMCDENVNNSLAALKLISDWFVTSNLIKKLFTALYGAENVPYFNESSGDAVFDYNEIGIINIDLNNINLEMKWLLLILT